MARFTGDEAGMVFAYSEEEIPGSEVKRDSSLRGLRSE